MSGRPGTTSAMASTRNRYVAMETRKGWGDRYPEDVRNGDWAFQSFQPDRTVNRSKNVQRCMGCHQGRAKNDDVFTVDRLRAASLSEAETLLCLAHTSGVERSDLAPGLIVLFAQSSNASHRASN
ncbi:cytochrome P460 family protein [Ralstonia pseudosolanacearum]